MSLIQIILLIIITYFLLAFVFPALLVPNLWLYKIKYKATSKKLKQKIKELNKIKDDEKFVKASFLFVAKKYKATSNPAKFLLYLNRLFWHNPNKIINENGFAYCHIQNLMLKTILIESKRLSQKQVKTKITFFGHVIHQYLEVDINGKKIEIDPWAYDIGIPFGKHLNLSKRLSRKHKEKT